MSWYRWESDTLHLFLQVQPRASRDEVAGVEGEANAHLQKFLAKQLGVPRSRVRVVSGESGRQKHLAVEAPAKLPPPFDTTR